MKLPAAILLTSVLFVFGYDQEDCFRSIRLAFEMPGNVSITGIFDAHTGESCSQESDQGLEDMSAAMWTVAALNYHNYLPGLQIGLSLFDACGTTEAAQKTLVQAMVHEFCHKEDSYNIGTLTTPEIDDRLTSLSATVNKTMTRIEHLLDSSMLLEMIVQLLTSLRWTTVNRVIADTQTMLNKFSLKTSEEGICVYDEVLISNIHAANNEVLYPEDILEEEIVSKDLPVIIVIARSDHISSFISELSKDMKNMSSKWIIAPTDSALNISPEKLPESTFVILPLVERKEMQNKSILKEEVLADPLNHREVTKSPLFVKMAASVLSLLRPLKKAQMEFCSEMNPKSKEPCPEVLNIIKKAELTAPKSLTTAPDDFEKALEALGIETTDNDEMFLYITSLLRDKKFEDAAIFQIFDPKAKKVKPVLLIVNEKLLNDDYRTVRRKRSSGENTFKVDMNDIAEVRMQQKRTKIEPEPLVFELYETAKGNASAEEEEEEEVNLFEDLLRHPCSVVFKNEDNNMTKNCGVCQNFLKYQVRTSVQEKREIEASPFENSWRFELWVAINASIATIGVICTVMVVAFIIVRMCKGDILEGSPYFSFLILSAVILIYAATLPFSFEAKGTNFPICELRIVGPTLSYSILFSIMLSRSLMLASSDQEGGFMSHVNGYLQTVLCFFMCGVQIALTSQYWLFNSYVRVDENGDCYDMYKNHKIIILLGYSYFLLIILAAVSPFMFRSKRNYKEGMFFTVAIFAVIVIWSIWISLYFVFPIEYKDGAMAFGLTATATAILSCVFIPRTYLIMTAIVRYKIANALPPLGYNPGADVSEINYRSNQALYDSVTIPCRTPKIGLPNPNFYSVNPTDSVPGTPNGNYYSTESTLKASTPKMTESLENSRKNFGASRPATPDNTYESYGTPPSPRRVTKF